jgi:hypothetical protein
MSGLPETEQKDDRVVASGGVATVLGRGGTNPYRHPAKSFDIVSTPPFCKETSKC